MKYNNFDFEQLLMDCWNVTTDIDTLYKAIGDRPDPLTEDEVMNTLLGIQHLYELKFQELFRMFEKSITYNPLVGDKVTRLEVIDHTDGGEGRAYTKRSADPIKINCQLQDDDRTLKIFLKD